MSRAALFLLIGLNACTVSRTRQIVTSSTTPPPAPAAEATAVEDEADPGPMLGPADEADEVEEEPTVVAEPAPPPLTQPERPPHPLAEVPDEQLEAMLLEDPAALGPMSIGRTSAGALFNAVAMPEGDLWKVVNPRQTFGTTETIDSLTHCIQRVAEQFPDTRPIYIGDISEPNGGRIDRHLSHQSGRDVDVGYYYLDDEPWYTRATAANLDLPRTWSLIKVMITETDVERIFIDHSIQRLLRDYALAAGEDPTWLDRVFGGDSTTERPLILHEEGHDTHLHVRFYNPVAQETGRRLYRYLIAHKKISPPTYYVHHKVRRGDTLNRLARKYGTSVSSIKRANGLRNNKIIAGRRYRIPQRGGVIPQAQALTIPPRRLPAQDGTAPPTVVASPER